MNSHSDVCGVILFLLLVCSLISLVLVNANCSLTICDFGLSRLTNNSRILMKQNQQKNANGKQGYTINSAANSPARSHSPADAIPSAASNRSPTFHRNVVHKSMKKSTTSTTAAA